MPARPTATLSAAVWSGRIDRARQVRDALAAQGIAARCARSGTVRVAPADAERARALLIGRWPVGLVRAAEDALGHCHACGATLSAGAWTCPVCGAVVGDPHGR